MSLLIDALKRAEQTKRAHTEPQLAQPRMIAPAIEPEAKAREWTLTEPAPDPIVDEIAPNFSAAPSRTEPKFFPPAADAGHAPSPQSPLAAADATSSSGKFESHRVSKEREAAQTLFQAKRAAPRSRAGILMVGGLAALLLAAGGFYIWYSFAFPPSRPVQQVQVRDPALPAAPASAASAAPLIAIVAPATRSAAEAPPLPPVTPSFSPAAATPAAEVAPVSPAAGKPPKAKRTRRGASKASVARPERVPSKEFSTEDTVRSEIEQARRGRGVTTRRSAKNAGAINVSRDNRGGEDFDPDLTLAYNSLLSGEHAEAKRLYSIAAERDPSNVDALLGLATIAANQGELNPAERYYRRALELEPQNAAALAGLASIRQPGGPSESQIKFELARTPDSAQLHFALGNQYANQGRWDEAQQAYFDAHSLATGNPDYAYNLAVSLDQLGQIKHAVSYYRKALDLAKNQSARFRSADVASRLSELAAAP
ncbi:MAG: tetratricopeptide repeat protein [Pseudomonadota bacterium]|nr:tetratricopeptide repeat protein [Pseudomonadota bacterium]